LDRTLAEARENIGRYLEEYNHDWPHGRVDNRSPHEAYLAFAVLKTRPRRPKIGLGAFTAAVGIPVPLDCDPYRLGVNFNKALQNGDDTVVLFLTFRTMEVLAVARTKIRGPIPHEIAGDGYERGGKSDAGLQGRTRQPFLLTIY
jgi:hypothetical protein